MKSLYIHIFFDFLNFLNRRWRSNVSQYFDGGGFIRNETVVRYGSAAGIYAPTPLFMHFVHVKHRQHKIEHHQHSRLHIHLHLPTFSSYLYQKGE